MSDDDAINQEDFAEEIIMDAVKRLQRVIERLLADRRELNKELEIYKKNNELRLK